MATKRTPLESLIDAVVAASDAINKAAGKVKTPKPSKHPSAPSIPNLLPMPDNVDSGLVSALKDAVKALAKAVDTVSEPLKDAPGGHDPQNFRDPTL